MTDLLNNNLPFASDSDASGTSRITQFYNNRSVFITGVTGFMGKVKLILVFKHDVQNITHFFTIPTFD